MKIQWKNFGTGNTFQFEIKREAYNYPLHIHQFVELMLIFDGEVEATVSGRKETAHSGQAILIFPFQTHSYASARRSTLVIYTFSPDLIAKFLRDAERRVGERSVFDPSLLTIKMFADRMLREHDFSHKSLYGVLACLYSMLYDFTGQVPLAAGSTDNHVISRLLSYLDMHYAEPLTLNAVAREIGYSESHLSKLIHHSMGFNYSTLLGYIRIEHAKTMLTETEKSIIEIAGECGFGCDRSFHRQFKSVTGMTPNKYRAERKLTVTEYAAPVQFDFF